MLVFLNSSNVVFLKIKQNSKRKFKKWGKDITSNKNESKGSLNMEMLNPIHKKNRNQKYTEMINFLPMNTGKN